MPRRSKGRKTTAASSYYGIANKYAKRAYKKAVKGAYRRYANPAGLTQLISDVKLLKSMVNAEKKRYTVTGQNQTVGQINVSSTGYHSLDITPVPQQGTTSITRNGNSIRLHSSYMQFQFIQQSATSTDIKGEIMIVAIAGDNISSVPTYFNQLFLGNPFVTGGFCVDYNSSINPDFYKTCKIVARKRFYIKEDQLSSQVIQKSVKLPLKYADHHVRFQADGNNVPASGQLFMIIRCDAGNCGASPSTLTGLVTQVANTGLTVSYNILHYFYDN